MPHSNSRAENECLVPKGWRLSFGDRNAQIQTSMHLNECQGFITT